MWGVGSCFTVTLTAGRARPAPGRFDFEKETVVQEETASDRDIIGRAVSVDDLMGMITALLDALPPHRTVQYYFFFSF